MSTITCMNCKWELYPVLGSEQSWCARPKGPIKTCEEERTKGECGTKAIYFQKK